MAEAAVGGAEGPEASADAKVGRRRWWLLGLVMAAGMLITIPALALFLAVQRHLVEGWGSGGLKG